LYADAYRIRLLLGNERERTPQTDFEQARSQFFWVRLEGDALMARYRAYPLLRSSEIPEPLLEPLEQKLRAKQEITLDEWAAFATQLTPMQIARAEGWIRLAGQPASRDARAAGEPRGRAARAAVLGVAVAPAAASRAGRRAAPARTDDAQAAGAVRASRHIRT
jgi:hypothetical protein